MDYRVACPHCHGDTMVSAGQLGQLVTCPFCKLEFQVAQPAGGMAYGGRPFSFPCELCRSRLEAVPSMVGQKGQCPTCGAEFVIPQPFGRSAVTGGTQPETESAQPVHAYAAAGEKAPRIIKQPDGNSAIECPRCRLINPIVANSCMRCAMPFTLDGAEPPKGRGLATASLVLGLVGLPLRMIFVPSVLALIFGVLSMRPRTGERPSGGKGQSIAGIVLGIVGLVLGVLFWQKIP